MGRASRADAERHRGEIVDAASRLFRERGVGEVSVPEVMAAAGLTHGGFYRHFPSKDALAGTAVEAAFAGQAERVRELSAEHGGDPAATRAAFVERYLGSAHRDAPGQGCPNAALATEIGRAEPGSALRAAYGEAARSYVATLAELTGTDEPTTLADLATLVGAMVLARASAGDPLSDQVLDAVRERLR
jgi:TetR/AcrR family transcriptional regulator, transcriptional repressor for nem operon